MTVYTVCAKMCIMGIYTYPLARLWQADIFITGDRMTKACVYCGRIHKLGAVCPVRPKQTKQLTIITAFRSSTAWRRMRERVANRDLHLCRVCLAEEHYDTDIQVHHIVPLVIDFGKRLDPDNCISVCNYHHERAEAGDISADYLRELATTSPTDSSGSIPPAL